MQHETESAEVKWFVLCSSWRRGNATDAFSHRLFSFSFFLLESDQMSLCGVSVRSPGCVVWLLFPLRSKHTCLIASRSFMMLIMLSSQQPVEKLWAEPSGSIKLTFCGRGEQITEALTDVEHNEFLSHCNTSQFCSMLCSSPVYSSFGHLMNQGEAKLRNIFSRI